jgi:hypothetical protein
LTEVAFSDRIWDMVHLEAYNSTKFLENGDRGGILKEEDRK